MKLRYVADITVDVKWARYPFPRSEYNVAPPLALEFEKLGLYDLAWRVQLEEGKKNYDDPTPHGGGHSYYLRAANNAYRAGKKEIAWSFLMNAAVLESEKSFEPAMETAQLWIDVESGKKKLPEAEIATSEERKKICLGIVERYQKMNAHPRAWLFIEENRSEFEDADALIKKVQDDWLELVKMITRPIIANKIVMYGVQLYPDGADPLSIKLPWAFPEGGLEKLKEQLREDAEKAKAYDDAGFRYWYTPSTTDSVEAKYVSSTEKVVTLEKKDGAVITVDITNLSEADQNYVKRRSESLGAKE